MKRWFKLGCLGGLLLFFAACCAGPLTGMMSAANSAAGAPVSGAAAGIPQRLMTAYQNAAAHVTQNVPGCKGMRWQILAAIAQIESTGAAGHAIAADGEITPHIIGPRLDGSGQGGNTTPVYDTDHGVWDGDTVYDRAIGPFQLLPATFRQYGKRASGDAQAPDPFNADDAALTAATYLCGKGRDLTDQGQLKAAIYSYNNSDAYVDEVLSWIDRYDATANNPAALTGISGTARTVLQAALAQQGVPYSWGGGGPKGPSSGSCCSPGGQDGSRVVGFDCSGLTQYAFARVGVVLPRTAADQAGVGQRIPASAGYGALQPGDLVFYGYDPTANSTIHHVGIYLGNGQMINAPRPGTVVRLDPVTAMPDYAGGARIL